MATKIQLRRDTASDWTSTNPTLAAGEFGWESDTNKFKIGDGATAWTSLAYASDGDTAGITFVGDDSTGTLVSQNETFKIAGTQNVTTAVSGDTLTVTGPDLSSYATGSSTTTFTNKTFDANGTGNSISNIETADIAAGTLVTAAEGIASNDNDTTIPTSAAVKAYADSVGGGGSATGLTFVGDDSTGTLISDGETVKIAGGTGITTAMSGDTMTITASGGGGGTITALNNQAENRLVSIGSTTTELDGEANLTFDGTTLTLTGSAALDGVTITDNLITTNRSNDDLEISANGTGVVQIAGAGTFATSLPPNAKNVIYHQDLARTFGSRLHTNLIRNDIKVDSAQSDTASTSDDIRNIMDIYLDMNGKSSTASNSLITRGPSNIIGVEPSNSATGNSTLGNASGNNNYVYAYTTNTGDLTISTSASNTGSLEMEANTGSTITLTDGRVFNSNAIGYGGGGTENIGTLYHFKANAATGFNSITDEWGFHTPDSMKSLIGGVTLQNGDITTGAVSITDNLITTNRSNDDLNIQANGTGRINAVAPLQDAALWSALFGSESRVKGFRASHENLAVDADTLTAREYGHALHLGTRLTNGSSTNSNFRPRGTLIQSGVDLDGNSYTVSSITRGPLGAQVSGVVQNSSATAATLATLRGIESSASVYDFNGSAGDITITNAIGNQAVMEYVRDGSGDITITNSYGFHAGSVGSHDGTGTTTITNDYGFYVSSLAGTNKYAFYDATNSLSRFGAVILANQAGDPSGVTDSAHIYAKDDAGSSEVYVRDEAGNVTKISPHNDAGEWEYYSVNKNTGKKVRVNMERMIKRLEEITGETFIENE